MTDNQEQLADQKAADVRAKIDALHPKNSAGAKFFRALYMKEGPDAVADLVGRATPILQQRQKINPKKFFTEEEYPIYKSTWPQLFSRRQVGGLALAGAAMVIGAAGAAETALDFMGADEERGGAARRTPKREAEKIHDAIHPYVGPAAVAGGVIALGASAVLIDGAKLAEVSAAITQMALLEQRNGTIER